ncbi:MAG: MauE/DoxX family redox-associated membrane protein, partial [Bacteroidota bacterium]
MTIFTLVLYIAIAALALTLLTALVFKGHKSWLMTFLQNFCGSLFIFSGFVKAVDPLGTAFKMEQYFAEFHHTFGQTALKFIAPVFPWLSSISIVFSVSMIVFEIVLGLMLLMGAKTRFTSWAFLILVGFFTFLTGYTYLTGYVPGDANFFEFGKWGAYVETNMKVTDCGCFGDFLKLKPKVSFLKDVFLLLPAFFFVFRHRQMHQWFTPRVRTAIIWLSVAGLTWFCLRNFMWNEPIVDFRPFYVGADVRTKRQAELDAAGNVKVTGYKVTEKATGKVVEMTTEQYLKDYASYPTEKWELEQIKTEPEIEATKLTDFDISDADGGNVTETILSDPNYSFMVNAYKIKTLEGKGKGSTTVQDTVFAPDTIVMKALSGGDSAVIRKKVVSVNPRQVETEVTVFDEEYARRFIERINPVMVVAEKAGYNVFAVTAPNDPAIVNDFRHGTQSAYPFYTADDLLLKTIQRSNPGVVLWKDGKILAKWHY